MLTGLAWRIGRKARRSMARAATTDAATPPITHTIQGAPV